MRPSSFASVSFQVPSDTFSRLNSSQHCKMSKHSYKNTCSWYKYMKKYRVMLRRFWSLFAWEDNYQISRPEGAGKYTLSKPPCENS